MTTKIPGNGARRIVRVVAAALVFSCFSPRSFAAEPFEQIQHFFSAVSKQDGPALRSLVTPDFQLLEVGEIWDLEKLIGEIQGDYTRRNYFALIRQEISGENAWVSYWNRALITATDSQRYVVWLESAVPRNTGSEWRIQLLHSTRLESAQWPVDVEFTEFIDSSDIGAL